MNDFINSLETLIKQRNWPACLIVALTLPDICAKHTQNYPNGSQARYAAWFTHYMLSNYTREIGANHKIHIFLNGNDCYALRCSLLHEGGSSTSHQPAHDVLDDFEFVTPPIKGGEIHNNQYNSKLQLQIDIFSQQILEACKQWWSDRTVAEKEIINSKLLSIHQI